MERLRRWVIGLAILAVIGGGMWLWWNLDLRWRPHLIAKNQAEIARVLDQAGWVSPHSRGRQIYIVAWRGCPGCAALEAGELAKLLSAGVDTRVIMIAPADQNGLAGSTPAERATVAELWTNRDWALLQRWLAASPAGAWAAPGVRTADGDAARMAVIEAGRTTVEQLRPLLKDNGLRFGFPLLVWWTKAGVMHACVCDRSPAYGPVRRELGA